MSRIYLIAAILGISLLLHQCASNPIDRRKELKNCDFMLGRVKVESIGLNSLTTQVNIDIFNPNQIDVVLDKMDVDLYVNDRMVGRGFNREKITIKSNDKTRVVLGLNLKYTGTYKAIKELLKDENDLTYQLKGKVYYQTIFGDITFPFETERETK